MSAPTATRKSHAFSSKTQRRILSMLRRRAMGGDLEAAATLIRLAREAAQEPVSILEKQDA